MHKKGVPHVAFCKNYMSQLRALLPLPAAPLAERGSPEPGCSSMEDSPDAVGTSPRPSRRTFARRRITRVRETPRRVAPRHTEQDPLAAAGSMVFDCRPQVLSGAMDISGMELTEIRSMTRANVATASPPAQSLLVDPRTDYEDELVIIPPVVSPIVIRPPTATTSTGPKLLSPIRPPASATSVGISPKPRTPPVVVAPEDFMLFNAAMTNQIQPETSRFSQVDAAGPDVGLDASGGTPDITDRPREGQFDIHHDRQRSATSPQLLQYTQGCLFRMTSYDVESDGPNFSPEYGVQLNDPHFLEYVGAPESARLMSRSPEYWVHHMGREHALSAALQLQNDEGLIVSTCRSCSSW